MTKFRLVVKDVEGIARLSLVDQSSKEIVGLANMSWHDYELLGRALIYQLLEVARASIAASLGTRLWRDAQRLSEDSVELAKQKLATMDWTQENIESYADEIARKMMEVVADLLPEYK